MSRTRTLVVGAGAVGQPYARHLAAGGADVAVLAKPAHAAEARAGFTLYSLNRPRKQRATPEGFQDFRVYQRGRGRPGALGAAADDVGAGPAGRRLVRRTGRQQAATRPGGVQPGIGDRAFVLGHVPASRVVQGIITLISYRAPLPSERHFLAPGVAYSFPPLSPSPMSGPADRLGGVLALLARGGLPARAERGVTEKAAFGAALLMPMVAALETPAGRSRPCGGVIAWRRRRARGARRSPRWRARRGPRRRCRCASPAIRSSCERRCASPLPMPFDLETYLRAHFTKVGDQTRAAMRELVALGEAARLPVDGLRGLAA